MKSININLLTLICIFLLSTLSPVQAQLLKKIERGIQNAAEKVAEQKITELINAEIEEAIDSTQSNENSNEQSQSQIKLKGYGITNVSPAESYAFDHKIEMEMQLETNGEKMYVDYYLSDSEDFVGSQFKDKSNTQHMMTVIDGDREAIFTFMEMNGSKVKMAVDYDSEELAEDTDYTMKATGNTKTILGYHCEEYHMTGDDFTSNVWITKDAGIRFPKGIYEVPQKDGNNQEWLKQIDGWAMEMEMTDTSGRKPNVIKMKCLSIEKTQYKLVTSDYGKL